jgi:hypothetical protein
LRDASPMTRIKSNILSELTEQFEIDDNDVSWRGGKFTKYRNNSPKFVIGVIEET